MALLRRNADGDRTPGDRAATDDHDERAGASPGLIRALFTLAGVAAAGFLIWLASTFDWNESTDGFWIAAALLAGAGLALGLSQLFGGWTKWGWPTLSPMVFLFGFLPTLILGGWVLLAKQPQDGVQEGRVDGWSQDIGVGGLVDALFELWPAIPLVIGLILAFSFDTTGPRTHIVHGDGAIRDEDVHDYRREGAYRGDADYDREREPVGTPVGARTDERRTEVVDTPHAQEGETVRTRDSETTRVRDADAAGTRSDSSVAEELRRRDEPDERRTTR